MKLQLHELVKGKYYYTLIGEYVKYYFKFHHYDELIYYKDILVVETISSKELNYNYNNIVYSVDWYESPDCELLEEIDFPLIVDKFPKDHIDRIAYYRNKKIEHLLTL